MVRLLPEPLAVLDDWAAQQPDKPSRPEAIRRLIELGLKMRPEPPAQDGAPDGSTRTDWPDLAAAVQDAKKEKG